MSYFISVSDTVRDHFLDESNLRYLRVVLDSTLTLNPVKASCDATESYQRWSVTVKNRAVYTVGQYANTGAVVSVSHNGSDWVTVFTGFVSDAGFHRTRGTITDDHISFECVDATQRKGTRRKPDPVLLAGFKICDTTTTTASILHYLADLMGATLNATEIDQTKTLVELGDATAWEELQKVKEAYHADMYFDADGELLFASPFDTGYSAPTSEWTFQGDPANAVSGAACRIRGRLEEVYLPVRCNYAMAHFDDLEELSSQVVYRNTENYNTVLNQCSIAVAAGAYWPGDGAGDVAKLNFADPESGEKFPYATSVGTPTIGATGSGNDIEYTGGTLVLTSFNGSTTATVQGADHAQIILQNTGGSPSTITKMEITGTPYRLKADERVSVIDSAVSDAVDYVERTIDGKYAVSRSQIYDTLYYIKEEGKGRPRQFRFSAPFMPWLQRNAIVLVQPPDESAVRCRIDSYQHRNIGRTLQGMMSSIICTELGTYTPSGSPTVRVDSPISPILAKITSISPNAGATYRSVSTSAPTTPQLGDLWYQTDSKLMKRYSGSSWENTGASPLEESSTAGVDYENSTGNVQILSDGTLKAVGIEAVDGEFSGSITGSYGRIGPLNTPLAEHSTDSYPKSFTTSDTEDDLYTWLSNVLSGYSYYNNFGCEIILDDGTIYNRIYKQIPTRVTLYEPDGTSYAIGSGDATNLTDDMTIKWIAESVTLSSVLVPESGSAVYVGTSDNPIDQVHSDFTYVDRYRGDGIKTGSATISAGGKSTIFTVTTSDIYYVTSSVYGEDDNTDRYAAKFGYTDTGSDRAYWLRNTNGSSLTFKYVAFKV